MEMKKKKAISKRLPHRCAAILLLLAMLLSIFPGPFLTAVAAELESGAMPAEITDPTADTAGNTEAAAETTADTEAPAESSASTAAATESTAEPGTTESATEVTENTAAATEPVETTVATIAAEATAAPTADTGNMLLSNDGIMTTGGSSGSETGTGGGSVNVWEGGDPYDTSISFNIYYCTAGVTMQVVYFPYGESYNRNKSYDRIIDTVQDYTYTDENGVEIATVYDGITLTKHTFLGDSATGRIFKMENINDDPTSTYYKTVELVTGSATNCGGTIHPGYHDCVSGPAAVSTTNGLTTYTMPEPNKVEKFLKRIIFGSDYGAWDKGSVALDSSGNHTVNMGDDVSLYTEVLKYLGCEDKYIENYLKAYNGYLSTTEDYDVMIPTIIWSYVVADCVDSNTGYGFGYTGTTTKVNYKYIDDYAEDCCDGSVYGKEGRSHGNVSGKTFTGRPYRKLITSLHTVGDVVCTSYCNNITSAAYGSMTSKEIALDYFNRWWRGTALDGTTGGYASTADCLAAYSAYHNEGGHTNGCGWFGYGSYACQNVFGVHIHKTAGQRHYYGRHAIASGYINYIYADGVDNAAGDNYYFRGYWTPYGEQVTGTLGLKKDIAATASTTSADLENWRFDIYRTEADALAGTNFLRGEYTDNTGSVLFKGLQYGQTFYIKEAPLERQDRRASLSGWSTSDQIFVGKVPQDSTLVIGTATNTYSPGTHISISKSPSCSSAVYAQIENNPLYSLAGAEYTVYLSGVEQEVLVTDANGNATSSKKYKHDTVLTIQETKAPAGFKLNSTVYTLTVNASDNNVEVTDEPVFDPGRITFQKNNSSTGTAMGNTSYQGAIFKWEFWEGTSNSGTPTRTWYFETDALGMHGYYDFYLSSSYSNDELYIGADGYYELPLGYLVVTEVVAPEGYALMKPLHATISQDQSGGAATFDWTDESWAYITQEAGGTYLGEEPVDEETFGSFSMIKMDYDFASYCDIQGDVSDLAAKFQIINRSTGPVKIGDFAAAAPGEVCYEFWTGADGTYRSPAKLLPIGTYEIVEAQAPNGMLLNTTWSKVFTVTAENKVFDFTAEPCYDKVIRGGVKIYKVDALLGDNTGADAKLEGITYSVISLNYDPVIVNGVRYEWQDVVATMELAWNADEERWMAATANDLLPYGTYKAVENPMADGSSHANDSYMLSTEAYVFTIRNNNELVSTDTASSPMVFHNEPLTAEISLEKVDPNGEHLAGAKFLFEWSEDGITWDPVTFNDTEAVVKGGCANPDITDGTLTTDETGILTVAGLHPYLQYRVTEIEAPSGYALLSDHAFVGTIPADSRTVTLKVCNSYGYQLPSSGEEGFAAMVAGGTFLLVMALLSTVLLVTGRAQAIKVCYSKKLNKNNIS